MNSNNTSSDMKKDLTDEEFDRMLDEHFSNDRSIKSSLSNLLSWSDPEVKLKRSKGIKKSKQDNGALTDNDKLKCYLESFGPNRTTGLYKILSKKYNINISYIHHIASNFYNIVSDEEHKINLQKWNESYGSFGKWRISSPGSNLLTDYDNHWIKNKIPPSAIYHIRFNLTNCPPSTIRNYLLPWTDNAILTHPDGKIANGRYINFRKKQYPFLTDATGDIFDFDNIDDLYVFLKKYYGESLKKSYVYQILNGSFIKEEGPMTGWKFEKIK